MQSFGRIYLQISRSKKVLLFYHIIPYAFLLLILAGTVFITTCYAVVNIGRVRDQGMIGHGFLIRVHQLKMIPILMLGLY